MPTFVLVKGGLHDAQLHPSNRRVWPPLGDQTPSWWHRWTPSRRPNELAEGMASFSAAKGRWRPFWCQGEAKTL